MSPRANDPFSKIEERIADQESRLELLHELVMALYEKVKPETGHFAALALRERLSAADLETMRAVFRWEMKQYDKGTPITREEFVAAFTGRLPHLAGKLEDIMRAYRADNNYGRLCNLVLGE